MLLLFSFAIYNEDLTCVWSDVFVKLRESNSHSYPYTKNPIACKTFMIKIKNDKYMT